MCSFDSLDSFTDTDTDTTVLLLLRIVCVYVQYLYFTDHKSQHTTK